MKLWTFKKIHIQLKFINLCVLFLNKIKVVGVLFMVGVFLKTYILFIRLFLIKTYRIYLFSRNKPSTYIFRMNKVTRGNSASSHRIIPRCSIITRNSPHYPEYKFN